jgi:siroheme synthase
VCSEEAFGHVSAEFAWDDVTKVCYEYAATGTMEVWLKNGDDLSFKATRSEMEDLAARIRSLRPDLPVRCGD